LRCRQSRGSKSRTGGQHATEKIPAIKGYHGDRYMLAAQGASNSAAS
jgi:hypothetical protein